MGGPAVESGDVTVEDVESAEAMIYRVQLYTTKDLATAQSVKDEAFTDFGEEVILDYEVVEQPERLVSVRSVVVLE